MNEGLANLKKLSKLPCCVDDGRIIQDFMIRVLGVKPEDIVVLSSSIDFNGIVKDVDVGFPDVVEPVIKKDESSSVDVNASALEENRGETLEGLVHRGLEEKKDEAADLP